MSRFIELSHEIVPGMKTYPGLPEPKVDVVVDYEASRERYQNQAEFYIANLHLCGSTGTYVDSPRHRDLRAHDEPEGAPRHRVPTARGPDCLGRGRYLPGTGLRRRRLASSQRHTRWLPLIVSHGQHEHFPDPGSRR